MNTEKGFSLMELIVAVAIIAILTSIAIPLYQGYLDTAHRATAARNGASLRLMIETYFLDNDTFIAASNTAAVTSNYGWRPEAADDNIYQVAACTRGNIATCYKVIVADTAGNILAEFDRSADI